MNFVRKQRQGLRLIHLGGSEEIVFMRPPGIHRPGAMFLAHRPSSGLLPATNRHQGTNRLEAGAG